MNIIYKSNNNSYYHIIFNNTSKMDHVLPNDILFLFFNLIKLYDKRCQVFYYHKHNVLETKNSMFVGLNLVITICTISLFFCSKLQQTSQDIKCILVANEEDLERIKSTLIIRMPMICVVDIYANMCLLCTSHKYVRYYFGSLQ